MYDHDEEALFAMLLRISLPSEHYDTVRNALTEIGRLKNLSIRVWSPEERAARPRLAICTTYRQEPALALLRAIRDGLGAPLATDIDRTYRLRAEAFQVSWAGIPECITAHHRILVAIPESPASR